MKSWTRSVSRAAASTIGSPWPTWAPIRTAAMAVQPTSPTRQGGCGSITFGRLAPTAAGPRACCSVAAPADVIERWGSPAAAMLNGRPGRPCPGRVTQQALLPRKDRGRESPEEVIGAMRQYEVMVIFSPELEERTVGPMLDQFLGVVREAGGAVEKVDVWG